MTTGKPASPLRPHLVGPAAVGLALLLQGDRAELPLAHFPPQSEPEELRNVARRITLPMPDFAHPLGDPGSDSGELAAAPAIAIPPASRPSVSRPAALRASTSETALTGSGLRHAPRLAANPESVATAPHEVEAPDLAPVVLPQPAFAAAQPDLPPEPAAETASAPPPQPVALALADTAAPRISRVITKRQGENEPPPSETIEAPVERADALAADPEPALPEPVFAPAEPPPAPDMGEQAETPPASEPIAASPSQPLPPPPQALPRPLSTAVALSSSADLDGFEETADDAAATTELPSAPQARVTPPRVPVVNAAPVAPVAAPEADSATPPATSYLTAQGRPTFPVSADGLAFSYDDELILEIQVAGVKATDTVIAYGTRDAVYLPFGSLSRILDLAIKISDDGNFASGWFLSEDRTLSINLRSMTYELDGVERPLPRGIAQPFEGEMYLRTEVFAELLPLSVEADLRNQSILIETLEPFPFEERIKREADRARLASLGGKSDDERWPRQETPWLALSVPVADVELRAVSDTRRGTRAEADLRLAGDLAYMTAQAFISAASDEGLTASLIQLGRRDEDADLLGPLGATEFQMGDIATYAMPIGLRSTAGRGAMVTNVPFSSVSVFDRIDLRGVLPDGYEVELYRNDVLVGSISQASNDQYEFLQVPVDFGTNIFRLVFYGPQGQRREEVRRVNVGDGRIAKGDFQYQLSAAQSGVNLLDVRGPDFRPLENFGDWQAIAQGSYGVTSGLTAVASGAFFQRDEQDRWMATAGLRSSIGSFAVRGDAGFSDSGGKALSAGLGGRIANGGFTLTHAEYRGGFIDETRSVGSDPLRRATELDFNTSLRLGGADSGTYLPLFGRARRVEFLDGRESMTALVRGSARIPGLLVSKIVEYSETKPVEGPKFLTLRGSFDLATLNRSRLQARGSVGYSIKPDARIDSAGASVDYLVDDSTIVSASASYGFRNDDLQVGLSGVREFENFSLALDGRYGFDNGDYSVALRLGFSFGRDPLKREFFISRPGQAASGAIALRAFQDLDGDGRYGTGDTVLPEVEFAAFNRSGTTDESGFVRLGELGDGNRTSVQVDIASLPDIMQTPVSRGIEIVPRPGRIHVADFPIVGLSEVEGTAAFLAGGGSRGVSGVRLQLIGADGKPVAFARTELDGYYFFEQVPPGEYDLVIDPSQASALDICLTAPVAVSVPAQSDIIAQDIALAACE